jgi:hypothetical protein
VIGIAKGGLGGKGPGPHYAFRGWTVEVSHRARLASGSTLEADTDVPRIRRPAPAPSRPLRPGKPGEPGKLDMYIAMRPLLLTSGGPV